MPRGKVTCPAQVSRSGGGRQPLSPTPPVTSSAAAGARREALGGAASGGSADGGVGVAGPPRSPLTRRYCARRPAAMEEGMSSMQQKAAELEHMAEVLLTGEQLR